MADYETTVTVEQLVQDPIVNNFTSCGSDTCTPVIKIGKSSTFTTAGGIWRGPDTVSAWSFGQATRDPVTPGGELQTCCVMTVTNTNAIGSNKTSCSTGVWNASPVPSMPQFGLCLPRSDMVTCKSSFSGNNFTTVVAYKTPDTELSKACVRDEALINYRNGIDQNRYFAVMSLATFPSQNGCYDGTIKAGDIFLMPGAPAPKEPAFPSDIQAYLNCEITKPLVVSSDPAMAGHAQMVAKLQPGLANYANFIGFSVQKTVDATGKTFTAELTFNSGTLNNSKFCNRELPDSYQIIIRDAIKRLDSATTPGCTR